MLDVNMHDFSDLLTDKLNRAYENVKVFIKNIDGGTINKDFRNEYLNFTRLLDGEGHRDEANFFISICLMHKHLLDRPEVLKENEDFFNDLYIAFDELLFTKFNNPNDYEVKYEDFLIYWVNMFSYFGVNLAIPSKYYDEEILTKIMMFSEDFIKITIKNYTDK